MWNGTNPQGPNWQGNVSAGEVETPVGDLYIVPDPPTILVNPSIGLEERNEVPLPTKYKDFDVANLTASNINGNPNFDASKWSLYKAIQDVVATTTSIPIPFTPNRIYDIKDFRNVRVTNVYCDVDGLVPGTGQINAGTGNIGTINTSLVNVSLSNKTGVVDIDGSSNTVGFNALSVKGGTTLSGGGDVHGISIGALLDPSGTVNLNRIDVLPIGVDVTSATYITMESTVGNWATTGALSLAGAGALSLAGGSYIEYNSDQHYFINTSAGNDFTDIYVGNIHPATGGSGTLNINGDRGVTLANVKSINLFTDASRPVWNNLTTYNPDTIVTVGTSYYVCREKNANTNPTIQIPLFVLNDPYVQNEVIYQNAVGTYRAKTTIASAGTLPNADTANWEFLFAPQDITGIWDVHTPTASTITGDAASILTIGTINSTSNLTPVEVGGLGLKGKTGNEGIYNFNYLRLQKQIGSDAAVQFFDGANLKAEVSYGDDGKLLIQSDGGININSTGPSFTTMNQVKTINLLSDDKSFWDSFTAYSDGAGNEVQYNGFNWASQLPSPKVNRDNIPGDIAPVWSSFADFFEGNVRFDTFAPTPGQYYCKADVSGSSIEPHNDPSNWEFLDFTNDPENIWYAYPLVESTIVGDRLSKVTIGNVDCVNENGTYLTIREFEDGVAGSTSAVINSTGNLIFYGDAAMITGSLDGPVIMNTVNGDIQANSDNGSVAFSSGEFTTLAAGQGVTITALTGGVLVNTSGGNIAFSSADEIVLTTGTSDVVRINNNVLFDGNGDKITGKTTGLTIDNLLSVIPTTSNSISFSNSNITQLGTINGKFLFNYGFFYKTNTQTLDVANTARRISINTSGLGNGITLDTTTNIGRITFTNTGIFQVVWSGYLLHGSGGAINSYIWIRKNGTNIDGTGKVENNDSQLNETNLASSSMLSITANDYIEFFWAATGTTVPLRATASSGVYPAIPSFSCTIAIVG